MRRDMIAGIAQFLDQQFVDPAVAAVANVSPASITNGTVAIASSGNVLKDLQALISTFTAASMPLKGVVLIMSETNAFTLGMLRNTDGSPMFAGIGASGGSVQGITVVTSNVVGGNVILVQPRYVLYADEGGVNIDVSREATVQMADAPDNPALATTVLTSLWQNNLVGLRAERFINWNRAVLAAVKYVSGAAYVPAVAPFGIDEGNGGAAARKAAARGSESATLFGFTISRAAPPTAASPTRGSGGWVPVVRESFPGAWQQNVEVTTDSVLRYAPVFACVRLISTDIAKMRCRLVVREDSGIWSEIESAAFSPFLRKPNRYQSRIKFFQQWMTSKLLQGNTYVLKQRDARGVVVAAYVLEPTRVKVLVAVDGSVWYALNVDTLAGIEGAVTVPASEIMHDLYLPLFHPLIGVTPITACGIAALAAQQILGNSLSFFAGGSKPGGLIKAPGSMDDATL
jgi:hypothetical protein